MKAGGSFAVAALPHFWAPFEFGIGPAGGYLLAQPEERRAAIRDACFEILGRPTRPFSLPAQVVAVRGRV